MLIEGRRKCVNCSKEFEWFYQLPQTMSASNYDVDTMPKDKACLYNVYESIEKDGYKYPVNATVYCPHCDCLNKLDIK